MVAAFQVLNHVAGAFEVDPQTEADVAHFKRLPALALPGSKRQAEHLIDRPFK